MNKESRLQKNTTRKSTTLSVIHWLDLIAAAAAVLICFAFGAVSVGRWLFGG